MRITARWRITREKPGKRRRWTNCRSRARRRHWRRPGQFKRQKRAKRELERVKAWEEKCEKQADRFEKAAEWTEARFHLTRPAIPDGPPGTLKVGRRGGAAGVGSEESLKSSSMPSTKFVIVIPDGAADEPFPALGNRTALASGPDSGDGPGCRVGNRGPLAQCPGPVPAGERRGDAEPARVRPGPILHGPGAARGGGDGHRAWARTTGRSDAT